MNFLIPVFPFAGINVSFYSRSFGASIYAANGALVISGRSDYS